VVAWRENITHQYETQQNLDKVSLKMTRNRKNRSLIYVRCRFCGQVFNENSDKALTKWSKHIASCEKKHKEMQQLARAS
jgi:hypothetical protein